MLQCMLLGISMSLLTYVVAQNDTDITGGMSWTTQEPMSTTTEVKKLSGLATAVVVVSTVLGCLLLFALACGCYFCMRNRGTNMNNSGDLAYGGQYPSNNNGNQPRIVASRTDLYKKRQEPFWGVQHAVAASLERPYGYGNGDVRYPQPVGPSFGGQLGSGYSPFGAGSNPGY